VRRITDPHTRTGNAYRELLRRNPAFRRLWCARLISLTGDRSSAVALLGVVLGLNGSGFLAGVILAANMLSPLLVFPVVATVLDRFPRKAMMVAADLVSAVLAMAMMLVTSPDRIWIGVVAALGIAVMNAFSMPASQAALPNLVEPEDLGAANALLASLQGITLGLGPLVGGLLAAYAAQGVVFVANALSFLLSAWLIVGIQRNFSGGRRGAVRAHRAVRQGFAYVRSNPGLRSLLSIKLLFALAGGGIFVLLPVFGVKVFGMGDVGIGLLMAGRGVGALIGPFIARAFVGDHRGRLTVTIGGCGVIFGASYILFGAASSIWLGLPLVIIAHSGGFALWTMQAYGLQLHSLDQFRGRLFALDFTLSSALTGISMLVTGHVADSTSPRLLIGAEGAAVLVCAVLWTALNRELGTAGAKRMVG